MVGAVPKTTPTSSRRRRSPKKPRSEDSMCGDCAKTVRVTQQGIGCDLCDVWFHIGCQSVSPAEYRLYSHEECKAKWFCANCDKIFKTLKAENEALKTENSELKEVNGNFMEQVKNREKDTVDTEVQTEPKGKEECLDKTVQTEVVVEEEIAQDQTDKSVQTEKTNEEEQRGGNSDVKSKVMEKRMPPIRIVGDSMVKRTHLHVKCAMEGSGCTSLSGARITDLKERVKENASNMKDGLLVIQGGGNGLEYVGTEDTVKEVMEAVTAVEGRGMSVAVVGVLRRPREGPQYEQLRKTTNRRLQEEMMKLKLQWLRGKKGDVSFLDMDTALKEDRMFAADGIHLNEEGDARLGRRLREWVRAKSLHVIDSA